MLVLVDVLVDVLVLVLVLVLLEVLYVVDRAAIEEKSAFTNVRKPQI